MSKWRRTALSAAAAVASCGALTLVVASAQELPRGPVPIAFDKETCAHCHMHVGDPRFAAQLQTKEGHVDNFDDPGCLMRFLEARHPVVHAVYVHDMNADRWIERSHVAFVHVSPTPMGFGLGAVDVATPGAIPWDDAQEETRQWASHAQ